MSLQAKYKSWSSILFYFFIFIKNIRAVYWDRKYDKVLENNSIFQICLLENDYMNKLVEKICKYQGGAVHHRGGQKGEKGKNGRCFQSCNKKPTMSEFKGKKRIKLHRVRILCFITSNINGCSYSFPFSNSMIVLLWREVLLMIQENGVMSHVINTVGIYARRIVVSSVSLNLGFISQRLKLIFYLTCFMLQFVCLFLGKISIKQEPLLHLSVT